jgi:hypothetical protein
MQSLKNYNNEKFKIFSFLDVIWNSLNLTWKKCFINFHHFENSSNYHQNNGINLKLFEFPQNITLSQSIASSN